MHIVALGIDTETKNGTPITFQFYSEDIKLNEIYFLSSGKFATRDFLEMCDHFLPNTRDRHYIMFGHNLAFDLISLFWDRHVRLREETVKEKWYGWNVDIVYANVHFVKLTKGHKTITIIDTLAYFLRTLAQLAELVCPELPKLPMPDGLGQKTFKRSDKQFVEYAMRDAVIAYKVGLRILEIHQMYDVPISVSAPHLASKIFRKAFLKKSIPLPPRKIVYAAMSAYHGGKNGITVSHGLQKNCYSLDIISAYPDAMQHMPSFSNPALYKILSGNGALTEKVPPCGIYKISGVAKQCKWPILFNHAFKPVFGEFNDIWITGFELNEALRLREISVSKCYGYFYDTDADTVPSPLKAYAIEFFNKKNTATDKILREFWKLLLNSLYGKFIQTRAAGMQDLIYDLDEKTIIDDSPLIAGGLFNPFIGSLITGYTRAKIHALEHRYKALHTSTDGIQIKEKPKEVGGLGGLKIEAQGDILYFRNKLYIIYSRITYADKKQIADGTFKGKLSTLRLGYKIIKYALHGFHSNVETLEKMWKEKTRDYEYTRVNKLRESIRRNLTVNDFVKTSATLHIPTESTK
jgi:DNA polymerase type B, organellar and viral